VATDIRGATPASTGAAAMNSADSDDTLW
jgi:hypothetical protein